MFTYHIGLNQAICIKGSGLRCWQRIMPHNKHHTFYKGIPKHNMSDLTSAYHDTPNCSIKLMLCFLKKYHYPIEI